jgi:hypothetical protein
VRKDWETDRKFCGKGKNYDFGGGDWKNMDLPREPREEVGRRVLRTEVQ